MCSYIYIYISYIYIYIYTILMRRRMHERANVQWLGVTPRLVGKSLPSCSAHHIRCRPTPSPTVKITPKRSSTSSQSAAYVMHTPISLPRISLLRFVDSEIMKFPVDARMPPLKLEIPLESNPLKSRILVRELAQPVP